METLEGFPDLPAHWLRRAKPAYAHAGTSPQYPLFWMRLKTNAG
jgi:hypothetical protein